MKPEQSSRDFYERLDHLTGISSLTPDNNIKRFWEVVLIAEGRDLAGHPAGACKKGLIL